MAEDPQTHSASIPAVISREVVALLKDSTGRGPTKSRTHLLDDCVLVLLREGHTKTEEAMYSGGREDSVAESRVELSETIQQALTEVVERNLGRTVVGFMSSSHQHPDLLSFVFVLENAPVLKLVDGETKD